MSTLVENVLPLTYPLSFEQTVPRSLVHKRALENVLLTEVNAYEEDRFVCGGRIPRAHNFFNEAGRNPECDILFYTELGRQASIAISHQFLYVARDQVFIFEQSQAVLLNTAWRDGDPDEAEFIVVEIAIKEKQTRKNGVVSRVVADYMMYRDRKAVFQGTGTWTMQPAALFERLRKMSARGAPATGRQAPPRNGAKNVVIDVPVRAAGENEFAASLIVDASHPYFFDHPCDHVPGMLLLEGCAQLARSAVAQVSSSATARLYACDVNFAQFVECHMPTTMVARVGPPRIADDGVPSRTANIAISQQEKVAGTAIMSFAFDNVRPALPH
jgi:hypothetical protein